MIKKILCDVILNKKFNLFIEYIFILPLLYLIQYDYEKYNIITLFLSVFILIKNIIIIKILGLFNKKYIFNNNYLFILIYKIIKMFIGILFFFLQYNYKFAVEYNIWIANLFYLKYLIKFMNEKYTLNSIVKIKNKITQKFNEYTN